MLNDGIEEETIVEWWNNIPYELKIQKETESYDKIMEVHPKYPYIWYKLGLAYDSIGYKQKAKEYFHRMETTKE
jgi:tetratricopeptide (TPR) repeat protein